MNDAAQKAFDAFMAKRDTSFWRDAIFGTHPHEFWFAAWEASRAATPQPSADVMVGLANTDRCATCGITKRMAIPTNCTRANCALAATPQPSADMVRAQALNEAAQLCEDIGDKYGESEGGKWPELKSDAQTGARDCESAIRALATTAQPAAPTSIHPDPSQWAHVAVSEGGELRWMTGRKFQECELYTPIDALAQTSQPAAPTQETTK